MEILKEMLKMLVCIILYIWQLPQNIAGLLLKLYYRNEVRVSQGNKPVRYYVVPKMTGAITLGQYIFLSSINEYSDKVWKHEFGHVIQSLILGPLYLIVIGINSILHAGLHHISCKVADYYHFWTEKWANTLFNWWIHKFGWEYIHL